MRNLLHSVATVQSTLASYKVRNVGWWFGKGFWSIVDQGLFATSNFILIILLARWLPPQDYGAFVTVYTVFWLLCVFHTAFLVEPMLVFGPGRYKETLSQYLGTVLCGNLGFGVLASILLLAGSLGFKLAGSELISSLLLGLALSGSFIFFQRLMRRACYVRLEPRLATWGGLMYMILMLAGAYFLYWSGWLSGVTAFALMGVASLVAGLWLAAKLRINFVLSDDRTLREATTRHWGYGGWAAATGVLLWAPTSAIYLLLPVWEGLEATAALRAMMNLLEPAFHLQVSLAMILIPALVRARETVAFRRLAGLTLAACLSSAVAYSLTLVFFQDWIVAWLYDGQYGEYAHLLWLLALLPLAGAVGVTLSSVLRALERPNHVFWAQLVSTVLTLTVGLALLAWWGISGAAVGFLINWAVSPAIMAVLLSSRRVASQAVPTGGGAR